MNAQETSGVQAPLELANEMAPARYGRDLRIVCAPVIVTISRKLTGTIFSPACVR